MDGAGHPETEARIVPDADEEGGDVAGELDGRLVERGGGLEDGESGESLAMDLLGVQPRVALTSSARHSAASKIKELAFLLECSRPGWPRCLPGGTP
jgi:hypothetical protein